MAKGFFDPLYVQTKSDKIRNPKLCNVKIARTLELATMASSLSFLGLVDICDNFHIGRPRPSNQFDTERLIPFTLTSSQTSPVVGLIRPAVLNQLRVEIERSEPTLCAWEIHDYPKPRVSFAPEVSTPPARTNVMKELCERWRDTGLFEDTIGPRKWREEVYPVYRNPFGSHDNEHADTGNYAFEMERAACALFGVVTYGVHMTIYEDSSEDGLKIWVPTRAKSKQTYVPASSFFKYLCFSANDRIVAGVDASIIALQVVYRAGCQFLNLWSRNRWKRLASLRTLSGSSRKLLGLLVTLRGDYCHQRRCI
jgi:hypothetical protein